MTFVSSLKYEDELTTAQKQRVVSGMQRLRECFHAKGEPPLRTMDDTVIIATWNLREFGKSKFGYRGPEPYYYIASIIDRFDLVALQEIRSLYALQHLCGLLGSHWSYLITDVTLGPGGNAERMAYLYDNRKVRFSGLAAELVLPDKNKKTAVQLARSPYIAGFHAGWAQINLCTVHIYYGKALKDDPRRVREIKDLASTIATNARGYYSGRAPRNDDSSRRKPEDILLLGDFNIFNREDVTMEALTGAGFKVPEALGQIPGSNVERDKHYDQIAYYKQTATMQATGRAGVFDYFEHVYRDADASVYTSEVPKGSFANWRTFQMSDHLPMWCEFRIDSMDEYLNQLAKGLEH